MKKYYLVVMILIALIGCRAKSQKSDQNSNQVDEARSIVDVVDADSHSKQAQLAENELAESSNTIRFVPPVISADESVQMDMSMQCDEISIASVDQYAPEYDSDDEYASFKENQFKSPLTEALSTFSIDVDGASYSNFRKMINLGQLPPADAVRVEEFINYFDYNYPQPTSEDPIKITTEVGTCPWRKENRLLRVALKSREIPKEELAPSNLVFLIDVSGSMSGPTRLGLVKSSLKLLVNNLSSKDRVAIVTYAGQANSVLKSTNGNDKQTILNAIDQLYASGSTAGGQGIELAYKVAKENFIKGGNNRIIMCSDGDFNVGVSSKEGLEALIEKERKTGVFLSVLGYGMGNYKDAKMQVLAEKGNGNAAYIDDLQEANKVLVQEFGGTLYTIGKDVKLQLEFNPSQVQAYRLVGYESRMLNKEDFNDDTKDAGEMGVGHTVTALYEIVPVGVKSNIYPNVDDLKYQQASADNKSKITNSPELCTVKLRYKKPDGDVSKKLELPVIDSRGNAVSMDMQFASSVAMFAQLLKNSTYKGDASYNDVKQLANASLGEDKNGYRKEFVKLVELTNSLK